MPAEKFSIPTADGTLDGVLCTPIGAGPWPAVIMYLDGFGMRPAFVDMAQRLANMGYAVAVPNVFHRLGDIPPFDRADIMAGGPELQRLLGVIAQITPHLVMHDTALLLNHLEGHPGVMRGPVGCVGYCMGGRLALHAAGTYP